MGADSGKKIRPLDHIKVLDLSHSLAGPFSSQILADFGAEVIKIEDPNGGDISRLWGPPFIKGESVNFLSVNRGKKSVVVNLKSEQGKQVIRNLVMKSDVLLENFRPGTLDRLGFGYEAVSVLNSKMIYCSISGYGQTGPEQNRHGDDLVTQGLSGMMDLTGSPEGAPYKVGTSLAALVAGLYAVQGILLALIARDRTGKGQSVDVSLLDGQISLLTYQAGIYFATGKAPTRRGNEHPTLCPYETFKAQDGYINIAVCNDKLWKEFCNIVGRTDLVEQNKFKTNSDRVQNRLELVTILEKIICQKPVNEWLVRFEEKGIPAGPILSLDKVLSQPQVMAREMLVETNHPKAGKIKMLGNPVKLSETPCDLTAPPPLLGEHTDEIIQKYADERRSIPN
jgi:crotonobetainyl-CoA:carnitine CoA-transferase CaiB-like acyl-CoA transferase